MQENAKQIKIQWDKFSKSDKVRTEIKHYIYNIKVTFFRSHFQLTEHFLELICRDRLSAGVRLERSTGKSFEKSTKRLVSSKLRPNRPGSALIIKQYFP